MFIHRELLLLILGLTLDGRVHTAEIIGGHDAVPHSRPYMVLIKMLKENGKTSHCCGFLLNQDFVMTAAHCQAKFYSVLVGLHNYHKRNGVQQIDVKQIYPHKDFPHDDKNDIMLLELSSKANFTENVKPIALADKDVSPKSCVVSGWGRTERKNEKSLSLTLKEVNVTLSYNKAYALDNMYCSKGATGPAEGDSGGPLVCEDGKAYGVVSFYRGHNLTYFTKIPDYTSWIENVMKHD